jgi:hypothetical protein
LEPLVRPLLYASNTKHFRDSLNILFLNGSVFEVVEKTGVCSLISLKGASKDVDKAIDLMEGKSRTNIASFYNEFFRLVILPFTINVLKQMDILKQKEFDEKQIRMSIFTITMSNVSELERRMEEVTGLIINGAFLFSDLVVAKIYKGLLEVRNSHLNAGISSESYENMILQLAKLEIIEPVMRVSICPNCMNYELVISKYPSIKENCPKCGGEWSSIILYLFKEQFGKIKSSNNDLPLFISSYLKNKIESETLGEMVNIHPNAVLRLEEGKEVEVDVYIPSLNIGIECKTHLSSYMPHTAERAKSIAGDYKNQIMKYIEAGIKQVYIVANLPERTREQVSRELKEGFCDKGVEIEVIAGNVNALLDFLNKLSSRIVEEAKKRMGEVLYRIIEPSSSQK